MLKSLALKGQTFPMKINGEEVEVQFPDLDLMVELKAEPGTSPDDILLNMLKDQIREKAVEAEQTGTELRRAVNVIEAHLSASVGR